MALLKPLFTPISDALKKSVDFIASPLSQTIIADNTVAPVPKPTIENLKPYIASAYKKYPTIPKGFLETVLMKESSGGVNDANYNPSIGESAWVAGLTDTAKRQLVKSGYVPDFNTQQGIVDAAAKYTSLIQQRHDSQGKVVKTVTDPVELYDYYNGGGTKQILKLKKATRQIFTAYATQ